MAAPPRAARTHRPGHKWTAAERKALSDALRGRHRTAAQRAAESKRAKGRKHPHKGHRASAKERAALARGRALARSHKHPLTARERAVLARGRAIARARAKGRKPTAKQLAALARARNRPHPNRHPKAGHHAGSHRPGHGTRAGRIYPSRFGTRRHRPRGRFVRSRTLRTVRSPYVRGRHHVNNWDGGRGSRASRSGRRGRR